MSLTLDSKPLPLENDREGIVRVAGTRVTLETLIGEFLRGATAEEIVVDYPVLSLADVYAIIGYYLRERELVETYLRERRHAADTVRQEAVARGETREWRERLLARRKPQAT